MSAEIHGKKIRPICKRKVMEQISILDISRMYSPKIREKTKRPLIICPFHDDKNLGSCRIFPDTNTFKCEACGAHGDSLKLASGYLDIKTSEMNELLEKLVIDFAIPRSCVETDYSGLRDNTPPPERLTPEEYTELLHSDHFSLPIKYKETEFEAEVFDYVPCEYSNVYYRSLAVKDPEFHDWVICTVSRKYWLRFSEMLFFCQSINFTDMVSVLQEKIKSNNLLLKKGLVDKKLYRSELRLRNELLNNSLIERSISA